MVGRFKDAIINDICGERISDNIYLDGNGQLICSNCVLARTGTYDYRESELIDGGSDEKVVKVYRDESEVFDTVSMKSMNFKPLVNDHPDENVTPDTVRDLQKGFMTNVRKGDGEFEGCLIGDLVVTDPEVIELILSKQKRDLSVGYTADIDEENGRYVMKNIRGNHIALCEMGRAGVARIRDSVDTKEMGVEDAIPGQVKGVEYRAGDFSVLSYADKPNTFIVVKNYTGENPYMGGGTVEFSLAGAKKTADDYVIMENLEKKYGKTEGYNRWMAGKKDSAVMDFEAKGSFDTIAELRSYYPGASVESRGREVIVRLLSGTKLLYTYLNGSDGKLLFIRRVTDSIRDGVEVLGDSHKLRVGQRVKYFGTPCVVTSIVPNIGSGEFLVEFGGGGQVCGRHSYDEVVTNINQGKIRLLDSVVFDSEAGEFKFESMDCDMSEDYSDSFKDKYADCFADTASEMKLFRVSVGDKKFDTRAHSAAEAMAKVRAAVKDAKTLYKIRLFNGEEHFAYGNDSWEVAEHFNLNMKSPVWSVVKATKEDMEDINEFLDETDKRSDSTKYNPVETAAYWEIAKKKLSPEDYANLCKRFGKEDTVKEDIRSGRGSGAGMVNDDTKLRYELITLKNGETDSDFVEAGSQEEALTILSGRARGRKLELGVHQNGTYKILKSWK